MSAEPATASGEPAPAATAGEIGAAHAPDGQAAEDGKAKVAAGRPPDAHTGSPGGPAPDAQVPVAIELGWTVATLYRPPPPAWRPATQLPDVDELRPLERVDLELVRLESLLHRLDQALPHAQPPFPTDITELTASWRPDEPEGAQLPALEARLAALRAALQTFNVKLLEALACAGGALEVAYGVGASLRGTVMPAVFTSSGAHATPSDALGAAFEPGRIASLQRALRMLAPDLPKDAAAVVSESVGKWSDFYGATLDPTRPGRLRDTSQADNVAAAMFQYLLRQGEVWLALVTGVQTTDGLLSPEAEVGAAQAALSRAWRIITRVVRHYLPAIIVLLAALGGIVYLAQMYLGGAARVWTDIAAIASTLGVTGRGIGQTAGRLAHEGAESLFASEEVDAKAWAVTSLPSVQLTTPGVLALRRSGIAPSGRLGRS